MTEPLARRRLLGQGAALAAASTALATAPSLAHGASTENPTATVIVRWNARTRSWAPRPAHADFGVVFLSTNDARATAPTDRHTRAGDVWRRHPDADATEA